MPAVTRPERSPHRIAAPAVGLALLVSACGCIDWSSLHKPSTGSTPCDAATGGVASAAAGDPFADPEFPSGAQPYVAAARPFIEAIVGRDYAAAYGHLPPSARETLSRNQFVPAEDEQQYARHDAEPLVKPTAEQFVELMKLTEAHFGPPEVIDFVTVETDAEVLTRRDPLLAAMELGAMPDTIPVASRKAAVQAWVYTALSDEDVRDLAAADGISEDEVRKNRANYEGPYFKVRTVIVDDGAGAGPVIGYFEIAPPSIWD